MFRLLLIILPVLLAGMWFKEGFVMGGGEGGLPFHDLVRSANLTKWSWADAALGNGLGIGTASYPFYWFLAQLQILGVSPVIIQASVYAFLFILGGFGIYYLVQESFPNINSRYAFLSSLAYWFNPLSMINTWNRNLSNYMVFYGFYPFITWIFIRGLAKRNIYFVMLSGLLTGVFSYSLTATPFNLLMLGTWGYVSLWYFFIVWKGNQKWFALQYLILTIICYIGVNFWWLGQLFSFLGSSYYASAVSDFFTTGGNYGTLVSLSELLGRLFNITRLYHGSFYYTAPIYFRIFLSPLLYFPNYIFVGLIIWVISKRLSDKQILLWGSIFLGTIFLIKGTNPPLGEIFGLLFQNLSVLQVFRNPFEKFGFLLSMGFSVLLGVAVSHLEKNKNVIFTFCLLFVGIVWGYPYWSSIVFTRTTTNLQEPVSLEVEVPNAYKEINSWLSSQPFEHRAVVLPINGEGMTYTWDKPYAGVELSSTLFDRPVVSFNTTIPLLYDYVNQIHKYQISSDILKLFPFLNAKYLIWRSDIDFKDRRTADPEVIHKLLNEWEDQGLVTSESSAEFLKVYSVNDNYVWPKIYSTKKIVYSNSRDPVSLSRVYPSLTEDPSAIVSSSGDYYHILEPLAVYPSKFTETPVTLTQDDLLARLFHATHLPGDKYYFLSRLKERLQLLTDSNYESRHIFEIGILGKRAVEIYKLHKSGADPKIISKSETEYVNELFRKKSQFTNILSAQSQISSLLRDSLLYQSLLLETTGCSCTEKIATLMFELNIKPRFTLPQTAPDKFLVYYFEVPLAGEYTISSSQVQSEATWYIDGEPLSSSNTKIRLQPGIHEVAILNLAYSKPVSVINETFEIDTTNNKEINIDLPDLAGEYVVKFDFLFSEGNNFDISFIQDIDQKGSPTHIAAVQKNSRFHGWGSWQTFFTTSNGASTLKMTTQPVSGSKCKSQWLLFTSCSKKEDTYKVQIKNLSWSRLERPSVFLTLSKPPTDGQKTEIKWSKTNPTQYLVKMKKTDSQPEVLVFSELFNSGWEIKTILGPAIPQKNHILANIYANGWLITEPGDYELNLSFGPQKGLESGRIVTQASIGLLVTLLLWHILKNHLL